METNAFTEIKEHTKTKTEYFKIKPKYETTPHVLNVSSSLMGICFIVLTSLKVIGRSEESIIDEITCLAIILFMASCIFSFLSIRMVSKKRDWLETAADIILLCGLFLLFITTMLFSFNVIK